MLKQISQGLASLHLSGIHHGDAVAKNFAVNEVNNLVMFDFEDTTILEDPVNIDESLFGNYGIQSSLALKDVVHFWQFQTKPYENEKPFLIEEEPDVVVSEFVLRFLNPYVEEIITRCPEIDDYSIASFRKEAIFRVAKSVGVDFDYDEAMLI